MERGMNEEDRAYVRGHVVADGEERSPEGPRRDEAEQHVGVVDGGGVKQRGVGLGERAHGGEHRSAGEAAQVLSAARPPQRSRSGSGGGRRRPRVRRRLHFFPNRVRVRVGSVFRLCSSDDVGTVVGFGGSGMDMSLWPLADFAFLQTAFLSFSDKLLILLFPGKNRITNRRLCQHLGGLG